MEKELHFVSEIKAANDEDLKKGIFEGYASTFGNIDDTRDIIEKGAFAESLKQREPKVLWQHDMWQPCGKLIDAREDDKGLWVKVQLTLATTLGNDAYEFVKAGVIDSLSIGFRCTVHEYDHDEDIRTIKEVELFEFSLVTIPANREAIITGMKSAHESERKFEQFLRENGYDRQSAKTITSKGFKEYFSNLRDAGDGNPDIKTRDAGGIEELFISMSETI